ncbi:MAG TPA: hypothetical protein VMW17_14890 [Candidatus Binatia bacterium]|nr:hypothetical protein [Candidatus Binatia bacterium]
MRELIELSRGAAAELATEFRGNPRGELAAWLHIALEREGLVASLYERRSVESQLQSLPKPLGRSVLAKVNGICANEEHHVAMIRTLLARECAWLQIAVEESWGRMQGFVLGQLAGTSAWGRAVALLLLEIGARSPRERAAGHAVVGLDLGGFLRFSRTLEVTAVESYQRIAALLTVLRQQPRGASYSPALHLAILRILRDERVHRDVLHVLSTAFGASESRRRGDGATELPACIVARPVASRTDLNEVCRAILLFHYGVAIPADASPADVACAAADFWRWQMEDPSRRSYLVDCQHHDLSAGDVRLLGAAGLHHVVRGTAVLCGPRFGRSSHKSHGSKRRSSIHTSARSAVAVA